MKILVFNKVKSCKTNRGGKIFVRTLITISALSQTVTVVQAADETSKDVTTSTTITVSDLAGVAPSTDLCTEGRPDTDNKKIFFLYNVGTGKFLYPGGFYGTHTSLNDMGFKLWLETNDKDRDNSYDFRTTLTTLEDDSFETSKRYIKRNYTGSLYMDQTNNDNPYGWYFEPITEDGYTTENHIYRLYTKDAKGNGTYYLTATPDNTGFSNYVTGPNLITNDNKAYQYWKLISLEEYYRLFAQTPSELTKPTDATFVLRDPDFHVNNLLLQKGWEIRYINDKNTFLFGGTKCYKTYNEKRYTDFDQYQIADGNYFFAFSKNGNNDDLRQIVAVHRPGWYIFNCNGFSSANTSDNTNVMLYVAPTDGEKGEKTDMAKAHATPLNVVSYEEAKSLMENESTNIGNYPEYPINGEVAAGMTFAQGKYKNQVMYYVEKASETSPAYLQFGINIADHEVSTTNTEWTAFDNFRVSYAGEREANKPDLILDEDDNDLTHLTTTYEDYDNVTLHLNRTFTVNKWNTLILPVNLTYGQMKNTFGDAMKLAKLWKLTANSVQFQTVSCTKEDDTMLEAFVPYIIMVSNRPDITPEYTATLTKTDNSNTYPKTIKANHYDISMVNLKRSDITANVNTTTWTTNYIGQGTGEAGTMTCIGSLGKTYATDETTKKTGIIAGRDDLHGAYFMKGGDMWKVPESKQYGMKAFRCWFRLTSATDQDATTTSASKEVKLWLDGVEDNSTTGIADLIVDDPFDQPTSYKATDNAVYNLNGQLVRQGTDTTGLPQGLYIVKGHKVMVK